MSHLEKTLKELEEAVQLWLQGKTTHESTLWHIREILKRRPQK